MSSPLLSQVTFEHHHDGFGLGYVSPRLSWQFIASEHTLPNWTQTSYEVEAAWHSPSQQTEVFSVESDESTLVPWPTVALSSRARAAVRVRVRGRGNDEDGATLETSSDWSPAAIVEAGLLTRDDWSASFIGAADIKSPTNDSDEAEPRPLRFRKEFTLDAATLSSGSRARLYITGLGVLKAYVNGNRTSDEEMAPGWTGYQYRLNYRVHDVTDLLQAGKTNVIVVEVAEGWYAGRLGFDGGTRFNYGKDLGVLAQLEVSPPDGGQPWRMVSDTTWTVKRSPIQSSSIYNGEVYDARGEDRSEFDQPIQGTDKQSSWNATSELPWPAGELVAPDAAPVRVTKVLDAVSVFRSKSGKFIVDFGQNLVGKVQVQKIDLPKGRQVTLKHAEVMENDELGVRPLRLAKATDTIISAGAPIDQWSPQFTFHGFRYLQVEGLTDSNSTSNSSLPAKENFKALVMHTDMKRRGEFTCSNEMVNQLHSNIRWSMDGNFLSIPTDCPQRDERLGWTGDIQVFSPTANFLYDTTGMLKDWLLDLKAEQTKPGLDFIPPFIIPAIYTPGWPHMPAAIWDDVVVLTPYDLYQSSGDLAILESHFEGMRGWLDQGVMRDASDGLWDRMHWQLGDWLDPKAPADDAAGGVTDDVMVADSYLVHVTTVFADVCRVLGKTDDHAQYAQQATKLKEAFQYKYITPAGNLMSSSQTGISLALRFDLYRNARELETARDHLDKLVRRSEFHIATGFAGTPAILGALTSVHRSQLAYRMLLEKSNPSWLYPVTMGATTMWERWDSMLPDGKINPGSMTSFNHYALGAVADWLHGTLGGISSVPGSGWRRIKVQPVPGGDVTSAAVSFDGPHGLIKCEWRLDGTKFSMRLDVPPNSWAEVTLPSELGQTAGGNGTSSGRVVGSGTHQFTCDFDAGEWPPQPLGPPNKQGVES
ncbi:hypothetical protein PG996_014035 [Apiospora saccharicola]|uniref:alpha-L-rhamnosidase n=1 Tax=Apiospora saccharicola TaxID=335842 RepID=A0ABR1TH53_9PEZI